MARRAPARSRAVRRPQDFEAVVAGIGEIGRRWHSDALLANAERNARLVRKTLAQFPMPDGPKARRAIVVSAGPSLQRYDVLRRIRESRFDGTIVCVDGSLVKCLKSGVRPDCVVTLDPHPTRVVRWFGDPDFESNMRGDDYFDRQDLDVEFRKNSQGQNRANMELVDAEAAGIRLAVCSSSPEKVVSRVRKAGFDLYWWNPLVDDPRRDGSLTRALYSRLKAPCLNTGGTVGTAAWVLATSFLRIPEVAVVGMDLGYPADTPYAMTQTYYELVEHRGGDEGIEELFPEFDFPSTGEKYYTDPTYFWYRRNMLQLLEKAPGRTFNCTGGGTLVGPHIECMPLETFLARR